MRLLDHEVLVYALKHEKAHSKLPSREEAYRQLKEITGLDFGYDYDKWKHWIETNLDLFRELKSTWSRNRKNLHGFQSLTPVDPDKRIRILLVSLVSTLGPINSKKVYEFFKKATEQDFGYDAKAWHEWIETHREAFDTALDEWIESYPDLKQSEDDNNKNE